MSETEKPNAVEEYTEDVADGGLLGVISGIFMFGVATGLLIYYLSQHLTIGWR